MIIAEYSEFLQTPTQVFKIQQTFCVAFVSKIKMQSQQKQITFGSQTVLLRSYAYSWHTVGNIKMNVRSFGF